MSGPPDHGRDAERCARRFHEHHERFFAQAKGREPIAWDEMPASYHRRLTFTFEAMLRAGVLTTGPFFGVTAIVDGTEE